MSEYLNSRESVFAFISWLSMREDPIIISKSHDIYKVIDLLDDFCTTNNLPPISEEWPSNIKYPE